MSLKHVPKGLRIADVIMPVLNILGVVCYLLVVSMNVWLSPKERAMGIPHGGEIVGWWMFVMWVYGIYFVLNLGWGVFILVYRYWRGGRFWLLTAIVWIVAIVVDLAHQF
jgi:hypothetical protein